jgi:hypothetical protein
LRLLVDVKDPVAQLVLRSARPVLGDGDARPAREMPHGFGETQRFFHHQEAIHVAARVTTEAVEEALVLVDVEGGRLLAVEGAQALQRAARALQGDVFADHRGEARRSAHLFHEVLRKPATLEAGRSRGAAAATGRADACPLARMRDASEPVTGGSGDKTGSEEAGHHRLPPAVAAPGRTTPMPACRFGTRSCRYRPNV